jgi:hypothetical protein
MFPGWHRKLYGRNPVRPSIEMRRKAVEISSLCLRQTKYLFGDLLATELLDSRNAGDCSESGSLVLAWRRQFMSV